MLLDFSVPIMDLDCNRGSMIVSFKLAWRTVEKKLGRGDISAPFSLGHYGSPHCQLPLLGNCRRSLFVHLFLACLLACCVASVVSDPVRPHGLQPTRLLHPWDSSGKNTGVGCHFLLQCINVDSESEVAQSCLTPSDPMDCSLPGSSIHGIFWATVLEWGAIAFSTCSLVLAIEEQLFLPALSRTARENGVGY